MQSAFFGANTRETSIQLNLFRVWLRKIGKSQQDQLRQDKEVKSNGDDRNQIQGTDSINWAFVDSWFSLAASPTHFIFKVKKIR